MNSIPLVEWESKELAAESLDANHAEYIWRHLSKVIDITYPSPRTDGCWLIQANKWIGQIPLPGNGSIIVSPRCPMPTVVRMLDVAFRNIKIEIPRGLFETDSIDTFFDRVASMLATGIVGRARRGLYRTYQRQSNRGARIRGSIDMNDRMRAPWKPYLKFHYSELTADVEENQIVLQALHRAAAARPVSPESRKEVRKAIRVLAGTVTKPPVAITIPTFTYNRLNSDYQVLHVLSYMILQNTGPSMLEGPTPIPPFLVDMSRLFQIYIERQVRQVVSAGFRVEAEPTLWFGDDKLVPFHPDVVVRNTTTDEPVFVLDVKYIFSDLPSSREISQLITYANLLSCKEAVIVYPSKMREVDETVRGVRLRTVGFPLDDGLEKTTDAFQKRLQTLL